MGWGGGGWGEGGETLCNKKLGPTPVQLFQLLMNLHVVPRSWKTNTIIPVPKEIEVRAMNDFRPVALTSVADKCFEDLYVTSWHLLPFAWTHCTLHIGAGRGGGVKMEHWHLLTWLPITWTRLVLVCEYFLWNFRLPSNLFNPVYCVNGFWIWKSTTYRIMFWLWDFLNDRLQRVSLDGFVWNMY